ncbi:2020_t:CDS:2, partial [Paraglomus occultum]
SSHKKRHILSEEEEHIEVLKEAPAWSLASHQVHERENTDINSGVEYLPNSEVIVHHSSEVFCSFGSLPGTKQNA